METTGAICNIRMSIIRICNAQTERLHASCIVATALFQNLVNVWQRATATVLAEGQVKRIRVWSLTAAIGDQTFGESGDLSDVISTGAQDVTMNSLGVLVENAAGVFAWHLR